MIAQHNGLILILKWPKIGLKSDPDDEKIGHLDERRQSMTGTSPPTQQQQKKTEKEFFSNFQFHYLSQVPKICDLSCMALCRKISFFRNFSTMYR
jgi:hypothetical protein